MVSLFGKKNDNMILKELLKEDLENQTSRAKDHFLTNIEQETVENKDFRRVLFTTQNVQLVLMSIEPGDEIGSEVHEATDQFIRVEKGSGKVIFGDTAFPIKDGSAFIIPQGTRHNIVNTSVSDVLKLYTIYSPPQHLKDTVQKTHNDETTEHFDGDTDII